MLLAMKYFIHRFDIRLKFIQFKMFSILQRHFASLRFIDLLSCPGHRGYWTIEVLANCPALYKLHAMIIKARDIIDAPSWVCQGSQELITFIDMDFPNCEHNRRFSKDELQQCRLVTKKLTSFRE
ncbi:hypothetical protein BGZ46_005410, partial [Entomortierella lignicola]